MAASELLYDWAGANKQLFLWINHIREPYLDAFLLWFTQFGSYKLIPYYLAAFCAVFLLVMLKALLTKERFSKHRFASWMGVLLVLLAGFVSFAFTVKTIKEVTAYPRPYVAIKDETVYHLAKVIGEEKLHAYGQGYDYRSFPSGHASFSTYLLVALWPLLSTFAATTGIILVAIMAWSRVSLGVHFPVDVLAGIVLSACIVMMVRYVIYRILHKGFAIKC